MSANSAGGDWEGSMELLDGSARQGFGVTGTARVLSSGGGGKEGLAGDEGIFGVPASEDSRRLRDAPLPASIEKVVLVSLATGGGAHTLKNHSVIATMYFRLSVQRRSILMGTRAIQVKRIIITA